MCFNPKPALISQPKFGCDKNHIYPNTKITRKLRFLSYLDVEKYKNKDNFIWIPCGKCLACRISHANDWATRCILESREYKNNSFITLSYNPKNLPKNGTLQKRDVQLFLKRLRKKYPDKKIRYFLCGEYGDKTLRAHYHIGFFNYKPTDLKFRKYNKCKQPLYTSKEIADLWGKGFIIVGELTTASAGYIARYTQKKIYNKHDEIIKMLGRQKEFILTSRRPGIGMNYIKNEENFKKIKNTFGILIKENETVKIKNIPQIYRNYWKNIDTLDYYNRTEENKREMKKIWKEKLEKLGLTEEEYTKRQNEITLDRLKKLKRESF